MRRILRALLIALTLAGTIFGQDSARTYSIGSTIVQGNPGCPVFVWRVWRKSPAAKAAIRPGDRLIAVDGIPVTSAQDAGSRLRAQSAKPVALQLVRAGKQISVIVPREELAVILERNGWKMVRGGLLVRLDATDAEIERNLTFDRKRVVGSVFPSHYPASEQLYYPGFEMLLLDHPREVGVGVIEDGPASRAGAHSGDVIVAVNGIDPRNKSVAELESLFSSPRPARMTLSVERAGVPKTFSFQLAQAAKVLRQNQWQMIKGEANPPGDPSTLPAML